MDQVLKIVEQVVTQPALLVGVISMIGLLLQKKQFTDVITGTVKSILGFVLIGAGADLIVASIEVLNELLLQTFNITGIIAIPEVMFAMSVEDFGSQMALIMALSMFVNLIVAKFSRFKFIYLTGHEAMWMSTVMAIVLNVAQLPYWQVVVGGALMNGLYMAVSPALIYKSVKKVTGTDEIAVGHSGTVNYWISIKAAQLFGNKKTDAENVNVPKKLNFLKDLSVSLSLAMFVMYILVSVIALIVNPEIVSSILGEENFVVVSVMNSILFAGGIFVIQAGVRMVIAELIPAFKGVAERLIPNAIPAVDIPVLYPYQPNSVLIGFIVGMLGLVAGFLIQLSLTGTVYAIPVILPTLFEAFFTGATCGALANKEGGLRGVIFGSFFGSLSTALIPSFLISIGHVTMSGTTFGGGDNGIMGIFFGVLNRLVPGNVVFAIIIAIFLVTLLLFRGSKKGKLET